MASKLSLIVPFYNEEAAIGHFVKNILPVIDGIPETDWEIVCVDDGSSDGTLLELVRLAESDRRFRVFELSRNFGKEAALTAGLDAATGDAVIIIDADLQDPPEVIPQMVQAWREGAEVVLGKRIDRSSDSVLKRKTASWFYSLHNRLAHIRIPENVGDFRLMDRCVVEALGRLPERQRFMKGLFAWVGFRTVTIDYVRAPRAAGITKFSGYSLWNFALEGFTSFSSVPIRLWTYLGTIGAFLAILYAIFIVFRTLFWGNSVPGYASLFVAIIFFSSVQIISIGMLGEYIGRIYMETKQRPIYVLRRKY
ncbi:glycosyltransferase family 2 protein [Gluconobacter kondonii]|uniref:Glycosyl transferase n=2 Tax=Gluconobacter kondonii TaxID=941463 RepID=A0ABQ5WVB2_9PROT|nr:glycosyltransferase family 2 protein [Gluconobacter kondonii]MBN3868204.1 glycosyltransferase family 2 protein [Gluconobacter kondonii]MBS1078598.1 glycosyltransferase family 2 protein [Gluconobacter kondonii]MBS1081338.1 glycosyltransferase family 2 protein [Gluconobacter kondonii]MBS1083928.1 glycosyltransferase family 2 protein [Gluconobacter kondonii]MCP1237294.1 glycosyltransferase family 2 protein [Gluconobacter kondonii]